jgi:hypothetical protein
VYRRAVLDRADLVLARGDLLGPVGSHEYGDGVPADRVVEELLAEVIRGADHPAVIAVTKATDAAAWCRLRVDFADGSSVYIGVE